MVKSHDTRTSLFILLGSARVLESDYLLLRYRIGIATMLEKLKKGEREKDKAVPFLSPGYCNQKVTLLERDQEVGTRQQ